MRRFLLVMLATTAAGWAQEGSNTWQLTIGGQGVAYSGNRLQQLELGLGQRPGAFLENLRYEQTAERETLRLSATALSDGSVRLFGNWQRGPWQIWYQGTSLVAYSVIRPGEERYWQVKPWPDAAVRTATGEPSSRWSWGNVEVSRDLGLGRLSLTLGGRYRNGERVPEFGEVGFAANGSPIFFPTGLCEPDSQSRYGELRGSLWREKTSLEVRAGAESANDREICRLAAMGPTGYLDSNLSRFRNEVTHQWVDLAWQVRTSALQVSMAGSGHWQENTPGGGDWRELPQGGVRPGWTLSQGDGRDRRAVASVGMVWWPWEKVQVAVGVAGESSYQWGEGDWQDRARSTSVRQRRDVERQRARLEVRGKLGTASVRLVADGVSGDAKLTRSFGRQLVSWEADQKEWRSRLEVAAPRWLGFSWRGWVSARKWSEDPTLRELEWGYLPAPDRVRDYAAGFSARRTLGNGFLGFGASASRVASDLDPPYFEPIYDPTQVPTRTEADLFQERATLTYGLMAGAHQLTAELGYLRTRYDFQASRPFPELAPVGEELTGFVAAATWEWNWSEKLFFSAFGEWVASRQVVHNQVVTGRMDVAYRVGHAMRLFGRFGYGDLTWRHARSREFTGKSVALGLQWRSQ